MIKKWEFIAALENAAEKIQQLIDEHDATNYRDIEEMAVSMSHVQSAIDRFDRKDSGLDEEGK